MRLNVPAVLCVSILMLPALRAAEPDAGAGEKVGETYIHEGAHFPFPGKVGAMTRFDVHRYNEAETDVSASYHTGDPDNPMVITVFVFPAPPLGKGNDNEAGRVARFKKCLAAVTIEIAGVHKDAKVISEGEYTLKEGGTKHKGVMVSYELQFEFDGKMQDACSDMVLIIEGDWQYEYRISYQKSTAKKARPLIDEFLAKLAWVAI